MTSTASHDGDRMAFVAPVPEPRVLLDDDPEAQLKQLPTGPGVFVLFDANDRPILVAVTQNLQSMITRRLLPPPPAEGRKPGTDVRAITRSLAVVRTGSMFEAEWVWLHLARALQPDASAVTLDRWRCWFVHADPRQEFPRLIRTQHTGGLPGSDAGTTIGPFPDKAAAGRFIDAVEDAFDLCRYHQILVQAPTGVACAYKEMGRCDAPCDGSVSMDAYRQAFTHALCFAARRDNDHLRTLETQMQHAADAQAYERAMVLRRQLDARSSIHTGQAAHARDMGDFRWLVVAPSERSRWARIFIIVLGAIVPVMDVDATCDDEALRACTSDVLERARSQRCPPDARHIDGISLAARHLFKADRSTDAGMTFIHLGDSSDTTTLDAVCTAIGTHAEPPAREAPPCSDDASTTTQ